MQSCAIRPLPSVNIRFVGLFDTVGSIFIPGNENELFYDLGLPSGCARNVVHLVAAQEWREYFPLTRTLPGDGEEIVLAGAHADIGGGYQLLEKCALLMDEEICGDNERTFDYAALDVPGEFR